MSGIFTGFPEGGLRKEDDGMELFSTLVCHENCPGLDWGRAKEGAEERE